MTPIERKKPKVPRKLFPLPRKLRLAMITMGISVGLAALTGAVVVPLTILNPHMWMHPLVMMMAVVALGRHRKRGGESPSPSLSGPQS